LYIAAIVVALVLAVVFTVAIVIAIVIAETSSVSFSAPIVPFRGLPTEKSPRIVLNGNQGLYRADTRIGNMTPAPVVNYAVRMFLRLLIAPVRVLSASRQNKENKRAKRTHRHTRCGKHFSHEASPINTAERLASGHLTAGNIIKRPVVLLG
jgi:hypothetical protein